MIAAESTPAVRVCGAVEKAKLLGEPELTVSPREAGMNKMEESSDSACLPTCPRNGKDAELLPAGIVTLVIEPRRLRRSRKDRRSMSWRG